MPLLQAARWAPTRLGRRHGWAADTVGPRTRLGRRHGWAADTVGRRQAAGSTGSPCSASCSFLACLGMRDECADLGIAEAERRAGIFGRCRGERLAPAEHDALALRGRRG